MFARIIPILRLPPTVAPYYDYSIVVGANVRSSKFVVANGCSSKYVEANCNTPLQVGHIVNIHFHGRDVQGVVIQLLKRRGGSRTAHVGANGCSSKFVKANCSSPKKIKQITSLTYPDPLITQEQIKVAQYLAKSAGVSTALAIKTIAPRIPKHGITKTLKHENIKAKTKINRKLETGNYKFSSTPSISSILKSKSTYLFHYQSFIERDALIQKILKILPRSKQLLILVPEISDIKQIAASCKLQATSYIHSRLTKTIFFTEYLKILKQNPKQTLQAASCKLPTRIIIGTKRALFMPFKNLGAIIIDEEHSPNHDNFEQKPYYSGRDIADFLRIEHQCPLILSSYAPSVYTWQKAKTGEYKTISSGGRSRSTRSRGADLSRLNIELVDMTNESRKEHYSPFSDRLREKMNNIIKNPKSCKLKSVRSMDIFIFHNRKGFATVIKCKDCGYTFECPKCRKSLIFHNVGARLIAPLRCNQCSYQEDIPPLCPKCNSPNIKFYGKGTQRIASIIKKEFPETKVIRIDKDSKQTLQANSYKLPARIIVGTEYALSRLDWSRIALVGIINIDPMLVLPSAGAVERVYQLIRRIQTNLTYSYSEPNTICKAHTTRQTNPSQYHSYSTYSTHTYNKSNKSKKSDKTDAINPKIIIQTHSPSLPIWESLAQNKSDIFYKNELSTRYTLHEKINYL